MMLVVPILDSAFVAALRSGTLTPEQVEAILPRDRAAAIFFLLQLSTALSSPTPAGGAHTPSGTVPPYAKPAVTVTLGSGPSSTNDSGVWSSPRIVDSF